MLTRKSGILALVAGALVLGACEQKAPIVNIPPVTNPVTVTIAGAPTNPIKKGTTVQLVAVVTNTTNQAVTWSVLSGATAASVSSTGLVTALLPGTAVIQAVSQADPTAKAAVAITVADTATGGGTIGQPSITIGSITQGGTTNPVNPGNVAGTIDVTMNVDIPTGVKATGLQLAVKNLATGATTNVPCQTFSATGSSDASVEGAQAPQTVICSVPTAQLTAGVPTFPNGQYTITAQLLDSSKTPPVIASATTQTLVFNNVSSLLVSVAAAKTAPDANGLVWNGGDLTVTVTPSIFASGTTFQTFTVHVLSQDTTGATVDVSKTISTTGVAVATVKFPGDSTVANKGLKGLEYGLTQISVTGVTTAGTLFDNGGFPYTSTTFKYDDAAPRVGNAVTPLTTVAYAFTPTGYLGAGATFSNTCVLTTTANTYNCQVGSGGAGTISGTNVASVAGIVEGGVDVVKDSVQFSPNATTKVWTTYATIAAVGNQGPGALVARVKVCDNLGNCNTVGTNNNATTFSGAFGVDLVAPIISAVTNISGVKTSPRTITVAAADTGATASGFPANYVTVQITKDSASSVSSGGVDVKSCVNASTGAVTALPSSGTCGSTTLAATSSFTIDAITAGYGYFTVVITTADLAGNTSSSVSRFFLMDATAPTFSSVAITYTTGATSAIVTGTIHDNVDLAAWNTREQYTGVVLPGTADTDLPFTQPTTVKAYGIPVQGNVSANVTITFVRGIQAGIGGAITNVSGLGFAAVDQAGNYGEFYQTFATTASNGVTTTDIQTGAGQTGVTASPTTICQSGDPALCADVTKTSTTVTANVVMAATSTANPIQTVYFYYVDAVGNVQLLSSSNAYALSIPSTGVNANLRVFAYTSSALSAANLPLGAATVFAIGVDSQGDGVILGSAALTVQ